MGCEWIDGGYGKDMTYQSQTFRPLILAPRPEPELVVSNNPLLGYITANTVIRVDRQDGKSRHVNQTADLIDRKAQDT